MANRSMRRGNVLAILQQRALRKSKETNGGKINDYINLVRDSWAYMDKYIQYNNLDICR